MRPFIEPSGEASALARRLDSIWRIPGGVFVLPVVGFGIATWMTYQGQPESGFAKAGLAVFFFGLSLGALAYWGHASVEECHDLGTPNVHKNTNPVSYKILLGFELLCAVAFFAGGLYATAESLGII